MSYEIIIKKKATATVHRRGEWTVVEERPWTQEEVQNAAQMYSHAEFLKTNPLKEIRGYAPDRDAQEVQEVEVLRQTVEELDLTAVIKAVNGIA